MKHNTKQLSDTVPVRIPELNATVYAKPGTKISDLRDKYLNRNQRLNLGGTNTNKGLIKF